MHLNGALDSASNWVLEWVTFLCEKERMEYLLCCRKNGLLLGGVYGKV